jgi:Iap family predicted aminopeptidase
VNAAGSAGVRIRRGICTVAATDAIIAGAGYPTVTLASVDRTHLPLNYHWPTDTPEGLHLDTIADAIAVCDRFVRRHGVCRRDRASLSR